MQSIARTLAAHTVVAISIAAQLVALAVLTAATPLTRAGHALQTQAA